MKYIVVKRFAASDETREFEKGRFELVLLGGLTIGRAAYAPGWKWSTHVGPLLARAGVKSSTSALWSQVVVKSQWMMAREVELGPGDLFHIKAGHDTWVVGDQPYVSLHFLGADSYAK